MGLSNDLISQFVKVTNDEKDTKKETTVYGTIVESNGKTYVQLDGSEQYTPVATTTNMKAGERVTVLIKNHSAIVTGNISSPSARITDIDDVADKITEFEIAIGDKVDTLELNAVNARIDELKADNVKINDTLTATNANIETLQADNVTINEKLTAAEADIDSLETSKLDAGTARITYATITDLKAAEAEIDALQAGVADIDTLIFGSASGNTIQTSFSNAVIAQLGDAQIKSAMIESIAASKITSGDIITNNVRVKSADGSLLISDETMQISDESRVRVQIGKDASGDYSINIWDQNGNLMFSKGGITDSAIKDAIIRNDMVSDTANIAAHKLDIDSLFEEINGSTNTIKSTQIYLDDEGQTLDVAFKEMSDEVTEQGSTITSQGTQISAIQGQISSKIWQQDIDTATESMSTQYSTLSQELDSISATVASHTSQIADKADSSTVITVSDKVTSLEQNLSGFKTTVSNTYATKTEFNNLEIGGTNLIVNSSFDNGAANWTVHSGSTTKTVAENDFGGHNSFEWSVSGRSNNAWYGLTQTIDLGKFKSGGSFVLSGWAYIFDDITADAGISVEIKKVTTEDVTSGCGAVNLIDSSYPVGEWFHFEKVFNLSVNGIASYYLYGWIALNGHAKLSQLKLEAGTKATDWCPAPEDVATNADLSDVENRVTSAETKITQNADSISAVAVRTTSNENAIASLELTADGLTARVNTNESDISTAQSTANAAKSAAATAQSMADAAKKQRYHETSGTAGVAGYVGICTFKITGSYQNRPIIFELNNRGQQASTLSWCFASVNNNDPGLLHLQCDGGMKAWAYKSGTSTWILIVQKSEAYDTIYVNNFANTNSYVTVTWSSIHYDALPTSNITEYTRLAGKLTKSVVDDAAKTATNYLNFSSSGLVVGDMTADTLGKNVLIDSDSVDIRNGTAVLASFQEDNIDLGIESNEATINFCGGNITLTAVEGTGGGYYDGVKFDSPHFRVHGNNLSFLTYIPDTEDTEDSKYGRFLMTTNETDSALGTTMDTVLNDGSKQYLSHIAGHTEANDDEQVAYSVVEAAYYTGVLWQQNVLKVGTAQTTLSSISDSGVIRPWNKILWSGVYYMNGSQTATLSEAVSAQPTGIVLIFSDFIDGAAVDTSFHTRFIPKQATIDHSGVGHCIQLTSSNLAYFGTKYLYVSDTKIVGHDNNVLTGESASGITRTCNHFVLRYVIGV